MIGEREGEAEERGEHAEHERHQNTANRTSETHRATLETDLATDNAQDE